MRAVSGAKLLAAEAASEFSFQLIPLPFTWRGVLFLPGREASAPKRIDSTGIL